MQPDDPKSQPTNDPPVSDPVARLTPTTPQRLTPGEQAAAEGAHALRVAAYADGTRSRRVLSFAEKVDRELRATVRGALLGDEALPTRGWRNMQSGKTRPAGRLPERALDARLHAHRPPDAVRAGLVQIAHRIADLIDGEMGRAA